MIVQLKLSFLLGDSFWERIITSFASAHRGGIENVSPTGLLQGWNEESIQLQPWSIKVYLVNSNKSNSKQQNKNCINHL